MPARAASNAFKGDDRYECYSDSDDEFDPDYRESSDDSDESVGGDPNTAVNRRFTRMRAQWMVDHHGALEEGYKAFLDVGHQLFGGAFFQLGSINEYAKLIFKYTQPGADS